MEQLVDMLSYYEPGEEVELTVEVPSDGGYKEDTVKVTLGKSEDTQKADSDSQDESEEGRNLLDDWANQNGGAGLQYGEGWN